MDEFHFGPFPTPGVPVRPPSVRYAPVRPDKFMLLSITTLGLYHVVWFYRNWKYVRDEEGESVTPWARTLFSGLFYFSLVDRLKVPGGVVFALLYLLSSALWRLPDPWWLVGLLNGLFLLPAVLKINRMNRHTIARPPSAGWRKRNWAAAFGLAFVVMAFLGSLGPPTFVQTAEEIRAEDFVFLLREGILADGEELLYFYSPGLASIESSGAIASDWGVTSYWIDPVTNELQVGFMPYEEIIEVEVRPSSHWLEDTVVRVYDGDGNWIVFELSAEGGRDREFIDEVNDRRRRAVLQDGAI